MWSDEPDLEVYIKTNDQSNQSHPFDMGLQRQADDQFLGHIIPNKNGYSSMQDSIATLLNY